MISAACFLDSLSLKARTGWRYTGDQPGMLCAETRLITDRVLFSAFILRLVTRSRWSEPLACAEVKMFTMCIMSIECFYPPLIYRFICCRGFVTFHLCHPARVHWMRWPNAFNGGIYSRKHTAVSAKHPILFQPTHSRKLTGKLSVVKMPVGSITIRIIRIVVVAMIPRSSTTATASLIRMQRDLAVRPSAFSLLLITHLSQLCFTDSQAWKNNLVEWIYRKNEEERGKQHFGVYHCTIQHFNHTNPREPVGYTMLLFFLWDVVLLLC